MPLKESLQNIFKQGDPRVLGEDATLSEALELENRATVAFLKGNISLEEYYQIFEETYPLTNTEFKGLASDSGKNK